MSGAWTRPEPDSASLRFLYHTAPGRLLLKLLSGRAPSRFVGRVMDSRVSRPLIGHFVRKYHIPLEDYLDREFFCFNDFFCRRIRPELRPLPEDPALLYAPCDGRLSAWRVEAGTVLTVKHSRYTLDELFGGAAIAERYRGGVCLVFRLCVDNYHRYCYPDNGCQKGSVFLPGELHTVRPIALAALPVFTRNCREYTVMQTEHFGTVTQMEIGALLVGKIKNHRAAGSFTRGEEKGMFLYGGSTVLLLLEQGRVELPEELFRQSARGLELPVRMGEALGRAVPVAAAGDPGPQPAEIRDEKGCEHESVQSVDA